MRSFIFTSLLFVASFLVFSISIADTAVYAPITSSGEPIYRSTLTIPSVSVGNDAYAVGMEVVGNAPLTFELSGLYGEVTTVAPSANFANGMLTISSVKLGDDIYDATLQLVPGSDPLRFTLAAATNLCLNCADQLGIKEGMQLFSSALIEGRGFDQKYTCNGDDLSLPLTWTPGPPGTQSYAIVMDDPDADLVAGKTWVHWNLFNIPPSVMTLGEGTSSAGMTNPLPSGSALGLNSWGRKFYQGPCPPSGTHTYRTKVYALSVAEVSQESELTIEAFEAAYGAQILESSAVLNGLDGPQIGIPFDVVASEKTYSDNIRLDWSAVSGATGYNIYYSPFSFGNYVLLGSVTSVGANHTSVDPDSTFYYQVVSTQNDVEGAPSFVTKGTTGAAITAPTNLVASQGAFSDIITLNWDSVTGATGYNIYYSATATGTFVLLGNVVNNTASHTSVAADTTYFYKLVATDGTTEGAVSSAFSGATGVLIEAPTDVLASQGTYSDKILLSWTATTGATGYNVYSATGSEGPFSLLGVVSSTGVNQTSVAANTTYYYKITATDGTTEGLASSTLSGFTGALISSPTSTLASQRTYTDKIVLSWDAVDGATSYKVYYSAQTDGPFTLLGTAPNEGANHTSLDPGSTYFYKVTASDGTTDSEASPIFSGNTSSSLAAPSQVEASAGTHSDKILINWSEVSGVTTYKVYFSTTETGEFTLLGSTGLTTATHINIAPGTTFFYTITSNNDTQVSVPSQITSGFTSSL